MTKHGHRRNDGFTREYISWANLKKACKETSSVCKNTYYGVPQKMDPRWESFEFFIEDMGLSPSIRHHLFRIDTTKPFDVTNCRWMRKDEYAKLRKK